MFLWARDCLRACCDAGHLSHAGSALFIFIACGAAITTVNFKTTGLLQIGISLTFGWTIIAIAWSIGHISGGHLNFAVTFSFVLLRKITVLRGLMYFAGQFFGGLLGIGLLKMCTPQSFFKVHPYWVVWFLPPGS